MKQIIDWPFYNYILVCAFSSWAAAQIIKALIELIRTKQFKLERLFGPGGMPSSHSATVCSGTIAVSRQCGINSPEFAVMCIFAFIVMYDAMGVRRQAGEHAHEINIMKGIIKNIEQSNNKTRNNSEEQEELLELKEILGHTPLQVLSGAILGVILAFIIPMGGV